MQIRFSLVLIFLSHFLLTNGQGFSDKIEPFVSLNEPVFALTNISIIDGTGKAAQENMSVVIREGMIEDVGPSSGMVIPPDALIIDAKGKTVIPGFVMLHEHIFYTKDFEEEFNIVNMTNTFPRMYLAGGVTTMRTGGSITPHTDLNIAKLIREGKMIGPKMDVTGP